mgnify:FL=1
MSVLAYIRLNIWRCTSWLTLNQQKENLVTETKAARNKAIKSGVKTAIKKVEAAVAANDKAAAEAALKDATSAIASAGSKGIFHKNNAARKVSRLTKLVNGLA